MAQPSQQLLSALLFHQNFKQKGIERQGKKLQFVTVFHKVRDHKNAHDVIHNKCNKTR